MRSLTLLFALFAISWNVFLENTDLVYEAARAVEDELSWAAGATLQRGCIESSAPPLVVTLEYMHRNDGLRYAQAYWPWHTSDWRVRDDDVDAHGCDMKWL